MTYTSQLEIETLTIPFFIDWIYIYLLVLNQHIHISTTEKIESILHVFYMFIYKVFFYLIFHARETSNYMNLIILEFIPEACLANNMIETFSRHSRDFIIGEDRRMRGFWGGSWSVARVGRIQSSVNCLAARAAISPGLDYKVFHSELIAPRHLCTSPTPSP